MQTIWKRSQKYFVHGKALRLNGATFSKRIPSTPFTLMDQEWKTEQEDTGETQLVEGLRKQFIDTEVSLEEDFTVKHHYQTKRGVNWIVEINPQIFERVIKTKKLSLGWERIGFKEYVRPSQCYKCGKFGHTRPAPKKRKLIRTVANQNTVGRTAQMRHSASIVKPTIVRIKLSWTPNTVYQQKMPDVREREEDNHLPH
ncbi:hypothetical protein CDAR_312591 [Caerostris darwini]|uniref:Uncharacterized protein n=1 Tax=Caerostris darwini TaxID=1538125 RepID=A0AAV4MCF7_9ARAC|nr:hypothetical protein CDAR_312591 [Caerostris darwini]